MNNAISIELVYATPEQQTLHEVSLAINATVHDALKAANIFTLYPELDAQNIQLGIFSQRVSLDHILEPGDRIEIYRPLIIDPKKARIQKVERQRKKQLKHIG